MFSRAMLVYQRLRASTVGSTSNPKRSFIRMPELDVERAIPARSWLICGSLGDKNAQKKVGNWFGYLLSQWLTFKLFGDYPPEV